jgi:hypothetical protein
MNEDGNPEYSIVKRNMAIGCSDSFQIRDGLEGMWTGCQETDSDLELGVINVNVNAYHMTLGSMLTRY